MKDKGYRSGHHQSIWPDLSPETNYEPLSQDSECDIAIIGGGIAGIMTAYYLTLEGKNVTVIEAERIGGGVSGKTTAHVSAGHDVMYQKMIERHSGEKARLYAMANQWAIEEMDRLTTEYGMDCQCYRNSEYIYATTRKQQDILKQELEATRLLGLPTRWSDRVYLPFMTYGAICYEQQAQFNPRIFLLCLAQQIIKQGGRIYEKSRVTGMEGRGPFIFEANKVRLKARQAVIASHFPVIDKGNYFAKLEAWRSYVVAIKVRDKMGLDMFDSSEFPTHYIRSQPTKEGPVILVGGESHRVGTVVDTNQCYANLEEFCRSHFQVNSFDYYWSSQDYYPADDIPYVGKMDKDWEGLYVACGFKGWGMTNGIVSGKIISDLIGHKKNKWSKVYDPTDRKLVTEVAGAAGPNLKTAKEAVMGKLKDQGQIEDLRPDKAAVILEGGKQLAVYRDEKGQIHKVSAKCTHMGCSVAWNSAEKSWDCPCHGSRFNIDGQTLRSPATKDLKKED